MWRGRPRPVLISLFHSPSMSLVTDSPSRQYLGFRQRRVGPPTGMSTTLQQRYQYRRRLPHLQKPDADLFITFCTARLKLPASARDVVLEHSLREGGVLAGGNARTPMSPGTTTPVTTSRVRLHAVVVMPDHVRLLFSPRRDPEGWPYPLVDILQCLCCTCAPPRRRTANKVLKPSHFASPNTRRCFL